ncbi:MAG TPA: hypothetical protein VFG20_22650, partial [Planctomycetaceae bacterium]|nr:hypothetical protein [Planctomycetaceae bacterium]
PRLEPVKPDRESFAPAIATAEAKGVRGFRVTRLEMEPDRNRVGVETRFVAKLGDDRWQTVFTATEYADSNQPRPELEARIAKDPQVKSMLQAMSAIGIVDDAPLQTAIRNGAATQAALQAADQAFSSFTNRYAQHVDRPKLFLPDP